MEHSLTCGCTLFQLRSSSFAWSFFEGWQGHAIYLLILFSAVVKNQPNDIMRCLMLPPSLRIDLCYSESLYLISWYRLLQSALMTLKELTQRSLWEHILLALCLACRPGLGRARAPNQWRWSSACWWRVHGQPVKVVISMLVTCSRRILGCATWVLYSGTVDTVFFRVSFL